MDQGSPFKLMVRAEIDGMDSLSHAFAVVMGVWEAGSMNEREWHLIFPPACQFFTSTYAPWVPYISKTNQLFVVT